MYNRFRQIQKYKNLFEDVQYNMEDWLREQVL